MIGVGLLIGLLTGTLVGASAIGSGSLVLPLLLLLTPLPAGVAVGTSLALAAGTKLTGFLAHHRLGQVNLGLGKWLIAGALPGAVAGALLLRALPRTELSSTFARQFVGFLLVALALALMAAAVRSKRMVAETANSPQPAGEAADARPRALLIGFAVAMIVTLTAIGSGGLLLLALLLWRPSWVAEMVGTTIFYGLAATLFGTFAHLAMNNVDGGMLAQLALGSVPGVLIGSRLTRRIPELYYQLGVAGLNLTLGLRLAWAG